MSGARRLSDDGFGGDPSIIRKARVCLYHLYLACSLGFNAVLLIPRSGNGEAGSNLLFVISWVAVQALLLVALILRRRQSWINLAIAGGIGAYVVASCLWSVAPGHTFLYGGMLAGNLLAAHLIANDMSLRQIMEMVARVVLVLVVLGLVAYLIGFQAVYYFDAHERPNFLGLMPMRGFFPHKIMAALFVTLGAVALCAVLRGIKLIVALTLSSLMILLTGSATGLILFVFALLVIVALRWTLRKGVSTKLFFSVIGLSVVTVLVALLALWERVFLLLGRDATLTGRTVLWDWGIRAWLEKPILGWGFNAYFESDASNLIRESVWRFRNYDIPHFHQSFIQSAVDLGTVGLLVLVLVIVYSLVRSYQLALATQQLEYVGAAASLFVMIVAAMSMHLFLEYNHFANLLLFTLFFRLKLDWAESRGTEGLGSQAKVT